MSIHIFSSVRKNIEKIFWDMEIIGNRRKRLYQAKRNGNGNVVQSLFILTFLKSLSHLTLLKKSLPHPKKKIFYIIKKGFLMKKWYFVTIIVLTYCEKKNVLVWGKKLRKKFANSRPQGREFVMFSRFYFPCTRTIFSTVS